MKPLCPFNLSFSGFLMYIDQVKRVGQLVLVSAFVLFICLYVIPAFAGEIYKWKDESGRIHFSDKPRNDASEVVEESNEKQYIRSSMAKKQVAQEEQIPTEGENTDSEKVIKIPYKSQEGHASRVIVKIKFNNHVTAPVLVDTGAPGMVISERLAYRLKLFTKEGSQLLTVVSGIGGAEYATRTILDSIQIKNIKESDVPAHIVSEMSDAYDGLIGMDILSGYMLTIDPVNEVLIAKAVPESEEHPGGHGKKWWQGMFRELKSYVEYWDYHAALVDESGTAYARMLPPKRERYKQFILHQKNEAKHLFRKFSYKANRYHVPVHWRR